MSWVALEKAIRKKKNIVPWNQKLAFSVKATPANDEPSNNCIASTHQRLVLYKSTNGLHRGLMTQGKPSQLVYSPISVSVMPSCIYITTATVMTTTLGSPSAK